MLALESSSTESVRVGAVAASAGPSTLFLSALTAMGVWGTGALPIVAEVSASWVAQTGSSPAAPVSYSSGRTLMELRRLTGLTWEQLARLFGVTRRSLHFWASGRPLSPSHEQRLDQLLRLMHRLDRGSARQNRTLLQAPRVDGSTLLDLLTQGREAEALALAGQGSPSELPSLTPLAAEERRVREPRPPDQLVEALQDRVHQEPVRGRAARSVRTHKR